MNEMEDQGCRSLLRKRAASLVDGRTIERNGFSKDEHVFISA
jgi:hypothetical protein